MQAAADGPAASAIDLAELLVEQGMPFRQAHGLIGGLVRESLERHVPLVELVAAHPDLGEAAVELLEPGVAVTRRRTPGGAGPGPVARAGGALRPAPRGGSHAAGAVAAPGRRRLTGPDRVRPRAGRRVRRSRGSPPMSGNPQVNAP